MISLVWFQSDLLLWLDSFCLHFLDLLRKHDLRICSRIDTICFDGDHNTAIQLKEHMGIQSDNTRLIRLTLATPRKRLDEYLSDICKDDIHHIDQHSVFLRMSSIFDNRNDIGTFLGHIEQISTASMTEFNGVYDSGFSHNIGDMTHTRPRCCPKIQNLCSRFDENIFETTEDSRSKL